MRGRVLATADLYTAVDHIIENVSAPLEPEGLEATCGRLRQEIAGTAYRAAHGRDVFDGYRDERQVVNGLTEFRGHASRSDGHEVDSDAGGRNLQRGRSRGQAFCSPHDQEALETNPAAVLPGE